MFLHAFQVSFVHPVTGLDVRLEAALPDAFERLMAACTDLGERRP